MILLLIYGPKLLVNIKMSRRNEKKNLEFLIRTIKLEFINTFVHKFHRVDN